MNKELIQSVKESFKTRFQGDPLMVFSPGRINLIGEHTDYNDGFVFPAAIDLGIVLAINKSSSKTSRIYALNKKESHEIDLNHENALVKADITVNKNMVPFDTQSPFVTSGIRVGTPAITTRGLVESDMEAVVDLIDEVISNYEDEAVLESVASRVNAMMSHRPLFV